MKWKKISDGKLTITQYIKELRSVFNTSYGHCDTFEFKIRKNKHVLYTFYTSNSKKLQFIVQIMKILFWMLN